MLNRKVYIGIISATITPPPPTKVNVVDCRLFQGILLVVMGELGIVPRPATIPTKE